MQLTAQGTLIFLRRTVPRRQRRLSIPVNVYRDAGAHRKSDGEGENAPQLQYETDVWSWAWMECGPIANLQLIDELDGSFESEGCLLAGQATSQLG
jgi:hypothetical protein